jgi:hypothetical protein
MNTPVKYSAIIFRFDGQSMPVLRNSGIFCAVILIGNSGKIESAYVLWVAAVHWAMRGGDTHLTLH